MSQATQRERTVTFEELGPAEEGTMSDEVIIALSPGFGEMSTETLSGVSHAEILREVMAGIEEEGVPWAIERVEADDSGSDRQRTGLTAVAHQAASDSGLKIGIGVSPDGEIALHHARLPEDDPLFSVADATASEARTVGTNAARLAKHMPLKPLD